MGWGGVEEAETGVGSDRWSGCGGYFLCASFCGFVLCLFSLYLGTTSSPSRALPACPPALSSLSPQASSRRMLRRLLERPCTLALLVGSQLAVMMYLSLGGFRSLSALFGREQGPTFDYSHPHDVYSNLSHLSGVPVAPGDPPAQGLPFCPERSPFLGECRRKKAPVRGKGAGLGLRAGGHVTGRRAELSVLCIRGLEVRRFGGSVGLRLSHNLILLPAHSWVSSCPG